MNWVFFYDLYSLNSEALLQWSHYAFYSTKQYSRSLCSSLTW